MQLIAHRGLSALAPENTLAAIRMAVEGGAKAVEIDVHQTKDGRLVVIHDDDLFRVAKRRARVRDMRWDELKTLDVGAWFAPRFKGERVPLLEDVLDLLAGKAALHLELKHGTARYPGIEERTVALLKERSFADVVISSFDHKALFAARRIDASIRLGYLLGRTTLKVAYREMERLRAESIHMGRWQVNFNRVAAARSRGWKTLVYTVDSIAEMKRLDKMGVDGIFTNALAVA